MYFFSSRELQKLNKADSNALKQKVETQQLALRQAEVKLKGLKNQNLQLGIQFEQEQTARLALQGKMAGRFLSSVQLDHMVQLLKPLAGQNIDFRYFTELETKNFAEQILSAFTKAG